MIDLTTPEGWIVAGGVLAIMGALVLFPAGFGYIFMAMGASFLLLAILLLGTRIARRRFNTLQTKQ